MLASIILATVVSTRVVVPAFEVENVPPVFAPRLSQLYVDALKSCVAHAEAPAQDSMVAADFASCYGRPSCLASLAKDFGFDRVVLGTARRVGSDMRIDLLLVDVKTRRPVRNLRQVFATGSGALAASVTQGADAMCRTLRDLDGAGAPPPTVAAVPETLAVPFAEMPGGIDTTLDLELSLPDSKAVAAAPPPAEALPPVEVSPPPPAPRAITPPEPLAVGQAPKSPVPAPAELPVPPTSALVALEEPVVDPAPRAEPPPAKRAGLAPRAPAAPESLDLKQILLAPTPVPGASRLTVGLASTAAATLVAALVAGGMSASIASRAAPTELDGVTQYGITRAEALQSGALATTANVLFATTLVFGAGAGASWVLAPPAPETTPAAKR